MSKPSTHIVWFKRDLRLQDHRPLQAAAASGLPVLLLYCYEPSVMTHPDSDERHWRFVQQSIHDINTQLLPYRHRLYEVQGEIVPTLQTLQQHFTLVQLWSHEETGNGLTFQRDRAVADFCRQQGIGWTECPTNGIIRRLKGRQQFGQRWLQTMQAPPFNTDLAQLQTVSLPPGLLPLYMVQHTAATTFQPGGPTTAARYLDSFLHERQKDYARHISKPLLSRKSCSRLSPYLAWGNLSMKQVYQATLQAMQQAGNRRNLSFFISRLHWHCHFIQKFETECRMETENLNTGFDNIRTTVDPALVAAWEQGQTGYPLVDACMRCVVQTGYLNFRMRSMVASFLTHHLWQPWQAGAHFLARQFLDYEPGIHYPQWQMQAGTMGVNTIRIYNPIKQGTDHDPEGDFVKQWVPELAAVPPQHIHQPWLLTAAEQLLYGVVIGKDYPAPVVDITASGRHAREQLWAVKRSQPVQQQNRRILRVHTKRKTEKEVPLRLDFDTKHFNEGH
jgi:deoxyribodipyrimidine photo-lyase